MVTALRALRTAGLRLGAFVDHVRWILLSVALVGIGLLGLVVRLHPAITIALAVVSLVLIGLEIRTHAEGLRRLAFADHGDDYWDVRRAIDGVRRFSFLKTPTGSAVIDWEASKAIAGEAVTASIAADPYSRPHELEALGSAFLRRRIAEGANYNGHVVGLDTNLGLGEQLESIRWDLTPARYWDHLASDILASKDVLDNGSPVSSVGRQLYIDRRGRLRDLAASWLLNAIGTSLLAITTDARLVLVAQSNRNESGRGLLAPSGSGSLEPRDVTSDAALAATAAVGAIREMSEEAGILLQDVNRTAFLGFGRWLEKAGKPELLTIAALSIDSHEAKRRPIPRADKPYTLGVELARLSPDPAAWDPDSPRSLLQDQDPYRLSLPVLLGLHLMAIAVRTPGSSAGELIRSAMKAAGP